MARYLIGCYSGWKYHERRKLCLATWFKDAAALNIDVVFVMAEPTIQQAERFGNIVVLPCKDTYRDLPERTKLFCGWAVSQSGWTHLMKVDDDTYVAIARLASYEPITQCVSGLTRRNYGLNGGSGYILDIEAALIVSSYLTPELCKKERITDEDRLAGIALRNCGIIPAYDRRFVGSGPIRPRSGNNIITTHRMLDDWLSIHSEVGLR